MLTFLFRRLGLALLSIWAVCTLTFVIAALAPGDAVEIASGGKNADPAAVARARHELGLDQPLGVRYVRYWEGLAHGDLGRSFEDRTPVGPYLASRLPNTALLALLAIGAALGVGIAVGLLAALRSNTLLDRLLMAGVLTGVTVPNFVLGPLLVLLFALKLDWLPVAGWGGPEYLVLPVVVLAARPAALIARLTRASVLETLRQDYIRTARAKGLSPARIVFRHALRNALAPVLTAAGVSFGYLLSGSFVVETIFTVPGVGYQSLHSLSTRDYSFIQATTLLLATIFVVVNLLVDLAASALDPRVREASV